MTPAERRLWQALRDRRFAHLKFRRQVPLGRYIVDLVSFEVRLVIEVDGGQHSENVRDAARDASLRSQNFEVLRLWNSNVLSNLGGALEAIAEVAKSRTEVGPSGQLVSEDDRSNATYTFGDHT